MIGLRQGLARDRDLNLLRARLGGVRISFGIFASTSLIWIRTGIQMAASNAGTTDNTDALKMAGAIPVRAEPGSLRK